MGLTGACCLSALGLLGVQLLLLPLLLAGLPLLTPLGALLLAPLLLLLMAALSLLLGLFLRPGRRGRAPS